MIWWRGLTKDQASQQIKAELDRQPDNQIFQHELLADLLMDHHPGVISLGIRPDAFRKTTPNPYGGSSYLLEGRYDGAWRKTSYRQTIFPPTLRQQVYKMFRRSIAGIMADYLKNHAFCQQCGQIAQHVDHVAPSFSQIASALYSIYSEAHWQHWLNQVDWVDNQIRELPKSHPHVQWLRYAHSDRRFVRLQSLCVHCHQAITQERKGSPAVEGVSS